MRKISDILALRLRTLRLEIGKSQDEVAKDLTISRSCLTNYELARRQPDYETLIRMANYYHVSMDYLTNRSNYRNAKLSPKELDAFVHIKESVETRSHFLDLSGLSVQCKMAIIEYCTHLLQS